MNSFELSHQWFSWAFENPEKVTPTHTALYFWIIEKNNLLGWKEKFGLPASEAMEAIGIKSFHTYSKVLKNLIEWGFVKMVQKKKNQYSANIIALIKNDKANIKALGKATSRQSSQQLQGNDSIDKLITNNQEPITNNGSEILDENENPFDRPQDPDVVVRGSQAVAELFGISELRQAKAYMKIGNFVRHMESSGQMTHFKEQFKYYRKLKQDIEKGAFLHSWENYTGSASESYEDGAWNKMNWKQECAKKFGNHEQQKDPTILHGTDYRERMKRVNEQLRQEALWIASRKKQQAEA